MNRNKSDNAPLTTQIARLARTPMKDEQDEWRWEWDEIAKACLLVARDAARMAKLSDEDWNTMLARILAEEARDLAIGGRRSPLHEDGTPITSEDRIASGEYVSYEPGAKLVRLPKPLR